MDRGTCESSCAGEKAEVQEGFLSQAVTGELVGMLNYLGMVELAPDLAAKEEALEHAESERRHAEAFRACARELGLIPVENVASPFWGKVRTAFVHWAGQRDRVACTLLQGVMLESFAAALYYAVGDAVEGRMAVLFRRIGREEESHVEDSQRVLEAEFRRDPRGFEDKVKRVHDTILPSLVRMMAQEDQDGPCGLCRVRCIKGLLPRYGMSLGDLRNRSLGIYRAKLDSLGLHPRTTQAWIEALPG